MTVYYFVYPFAQDGDVAAVPTSGVNSGPMSWEAGFTPNYEEDLLTSPSALPIPRTQFNRLLFDITANLQNYQQRGLPYWVSAAENNPGGVPTSLPYPIYARVRYNPISPLIDNGDTLIYENQVEGNTVTPGVDDSWQIISGGAFLTLNTQTFTTSGTYTPTPGMRYALVRAVAGGGGGGGGIGGLAPRVGAASGGSSGSYGEGLYDALTIGASQTVTIGAGGTGGVAGAGGPGGVTSLGALLTTVGGLGGSAGTSTIATTLCIAGAGSPAAGVGGYLNLPGNPGGWSLGNGVSTLGISGQGADSYLGAGGNNAGVAGSPGIGYGAGGNGGFSTTTDVNGGAGAPGYIEILEFIF